eukprot:TRINITY_DN5949_c0_g1_i1.p1 TRINITY_DN5949_c0_g1~~TRINITY_DN5949_c0_g1_i1.p1  ORF type:complete len:401 (-),score=111.36 TRINITY_DN5949_c0_g1_i1:41-1102(-)
MTDNSDGNLKIYKHHYDKKIGKSKQSNPEKIRRLRREIHTRLPMHPNSSVFLRVDSGRLDVMKAMITGPKDTPYSNGCFLFDIFCPSDYPREPPLVNLMTTGKETVRFNPNLYECGKVCLSLLGTWSGGVNEQWNEKTSTLYQVLVSIQSLIFVDEPYFNEPGYESAINSPEGKHHSECYNQVIRLATAKWAILDMLLHPPAGFEDVVKLHFKLRRKEVMADLTNWLKLAKDSQVGEEKNMKQLLLDIHRELQALDPSIPLELLDEEVEQKKKQKELVQVEQKKKQKELEINRWSAAETLSGVAPNYPLSLLYKALENNEDDSEAALNWVFEHGEDCLFDHPELFTITNPFSK